MQDLVKLLNNDDDSSYGQAAEIVERLGDQALSALVSFFEECEDLEKRIRVIKLAGMVKTGDSLGFIKKAVEDPCFEVRRTAALTIKLLTSEDYYGHIYHSEVGKTFKRDFWCYMDFIDPHIQDNYQKENLRSGKAFAGFFRDLSRRWTYPDPADSKFFSFRRKKGLSMADDGRILFKNFNYSIQKTLMACKKLVFLIMAMKKVIESEKGEKSELEDILLCLGQAFSHQLRELEEGMGIFIAAFHYIKLEFNLLLNDKNSFVIEEFSENLSLDEERLLESLIGGFIRFDSLHSDEHISPEKTGTMLVQFNKRLVEFLSLADRFGEKPSVERDVYILFNLMGIRALEIYKYCIQIFSCWRKDG